VSKVLMIKYGYGRRAAFHIDWRMANNSAARAVRRLAR
jgi:hypothetical protein